MGRVIAGSVAGPTRSRATPSGVTTVAGIPLVEARTRCAAAWPRQLNCITLYFPLRAALLGTERSCPAGRVVADSKDWAEAEADAQHAVANASLAAIDLAADVRAELTAIAEFITTRTW